MKVILTFIAVIFFTTTAFTQNAIEEVKVETTNTVELNVENELIKEIKTETEVARLYMFKNSRIKKALAFRTKRNKSKLA